MLDAPSRPNLGPIEFLVGTADALPACPTTTWQDKPDFVLSPYRLGPDTPQVRLNFHPLMQEHRTSRSSPLWSFFSGQGDVSGTFRRTRAQKNLCRYFCKDKRRAVLHSSLPRGKMIDIECM